MSLMKINFIGERTSQSSERERHLRKLEFHFPGDSHPVNLDAMLGNTFQSFLIGAKPSEPISVQQPIVWPSIG
jgi:hypothetical protein